MRPSTKDRFSKTFGLLIVLSIFFGIAFNCSQYQQNIDKFYHFAISRIIITEGLPREIPALANLGWDKQFPEKEFLFHQLTALGYYLGEENGVRVIALSMAACLVAALFVFTNKMLCFSTALLMISCLIFLEPYYLFRLVIVRPHLLAILFTILTLISCISARILPAAIFGLLFSLSYHAFYLPLGIFSLFLLFALNIKQRRYRHSALAAIVGILLGIIFNPYFPASLLIGVEHLQMALSPPKGIPPYFVGAELLKPEWLQIFSVFYPILTLLFLSSLLLVRVKIAHDREESKTSKKITICSFLVFCSICLWGIGKLNPRAFEYALPVSLIAICYTAHISPKRWSNIVLPSLLLLFCFFKLPNAYQAYKQNPSPLAKRIEGGLAALSSVDKEEIGESKIFNCHWDLGSIILYSQPNASFIDLLDPRLLHFYDPKLSKLRLALFEGRVKDPVNIIRSIFKADYILCSSSHLHSALENSKLVERIYPIGKKHEPPKYTPGLRPALYKFK